SHVYGFAGANGTDGTMADPDYMMKSSAGGTLGTTTETAATAQVVRGFRPFNFFGARENRIMYVTPSLMGARFRASYGEKKSWSVGLRYAGSPGGAKDFTVLFAAGYRKNNVDMGAPVESAYAVSGGLKHSSGFNLSGSYDTDGKERANGSKMSQWGVSGGWSGKVNDAGGTSIGIGYNQSRDGLEASAKQYWIAINQKIDAAAADVYAGISYDSGSVTHTVMHMDGGDSPDGVITAVDDDTIDRTCGNIANDADADALAASNGTMCDVKRKGVFNFVVGVRLKF
ncbi:MAG: hypothetical protein OXF89_09210, partial [Rhodospirillaceae bacterium]|nr:hypothetical protein [Rhodospirillaceae bacterium]